MRKKIAAFLLTVAVVLSSSVSAFAAEDATITFEGEAGKFATQIQEGFTGFEGMDPGETREVSLKLVNEDAAQMKFYLSGSIGDNIADKGNQITVYDISISKDSETEPFFQGMIGSDQNTGQKFLGEDFLLATLAKGESTTVTLAITLDGDSTGNDYQNQEGSIRLVLGVEETNDPVPGKKEVTVTEKNYIQEGDTYKKSTTYVTEDSTSTKAKNAKTGDETNMIGYAAAAVIGGGCIIFLAAGKRKRKTEE